MFERATLLKRMSPKIVTFLPLKSSPNFSRRVKESRRACVGWACAPSPAFMTGMRRRSARYFAAPAAEWRMIIMSAVIASRFFAVSFNVSPFVMEEADEFTDNTSAPSR